MTDRPTPAEVYWVTGDNTGIGKTTIACALIRALNSRGTPALGFKPYGAFRYHETKAHLDQSTIGTACRCYGEDVVKLALSSPLTSLDCVDLIGPAYYLIYRQWPRAMLARVGSRQLGNVEYFRSEEAAIALQHDGVRARIERAQLPIDEASLRELNFRVAGELRPLNQGLAFAQLAMLGPRAIVCEGAGRYAPNWQGCPGVNHIVALTRGRLTIYAHANVAIAFPTHREMVNTVEVLAFLDKLGRARHGAEIRFVPEPELRDAEADRAVAEILRLSGLANG